MAKDAGPSTKTIREAYAAFRTAKEDLSAAVARELPPGTVILVEIGNARIYAFLGEQSWSNPLRIRVTNTETGKRREISVDPDYGNKYSIVKKGILND